MILKPLTPSPLPPPEAPPENSSCTHVLVSAEQVDKLRELSRKTRIAQSEYLREAVDDLLEKYQCTPL
ncbi:MAG: ribbon-helix-helix domain-containing protein [Cystobacterineae bacterium]|nr:ribbon-helix-helix domain-containing protein [Cystobacterineae bacterium]